MVLALLPEPLLDASQASVTLDDVEAVIRRFAGAVGDVRSRVAAPAAGATAASARRAGSTAATPSRFAETDEFRRVRGLKEVQSNFRRS
jgi:hypothetical protein